MSHVCPVCKAPMKETVHFIHYDEDDRKERELIRVPAFMCEVCHIILHTEETHQKILARRTRTYELTPNCPDMCMYDVACLLEEKFDF